MSNVFQIIFKIRLGNYLFEVCGPGKLGNITFYVCFNAGVVPETQVPANPKRRLEVTQRMPQEGHRRGELVDRVSVACVLNLVL